MHKIYFLILICICLVFLGCSSKEIELIAPPDNIALDEVTKINLKKLDFDKLSKNTISKLDGIEFTHDTIGYEMDYRYTDKPIKIKIVKFKNNDLLKNFWHEWLAVYDLANLQNNNAVEFENENINGGHSSIYAWYKNQWVTCIIVPLEVAKSGPVKDEVKKFVLNHYHNLAKRDVVPIN